MAERIVRIQAERDERLAALEHSAADLDERIQQLKGKKAPARFILGDGVEDEVVLEKGKVLDEDAADRAVRADGEAHRHRLRGLDGQARKRFRLFALRGRLRH